MGCTNSVPVAAPPPESASGTVGRGNKSREAVALLENDASSMDVVSSHASVEYTFAKDYRIIRHVGGSVSRIYMVVKKHHHHHHAAAATASGPQHNQQQPTLEDASGSEEAVNGEDLNVYVMQVIDMKSVAPERRESMRDEIQSLKKISHANILRVCDVYDSIDINNTIQMVTELCTGQDLASYARTPCSEIKARPIVVQILVAINYMHKRGLFHHNLSLENIMFKDDSNEMVKITYAGLASRSASQNSVSHFLGGPRNRGDRDIYQIGSITYQLLSGGREPPTSVDMNSDDDDDDDDENDTARSSSGNRQNLFMNRIWKIIPVSRQAKDFVESAMQHGFLTVVQALQHRWITQEPIYLRGTGVTTLTDAKGNGNLVSVRLNLGSRTSVSSQNATKGDSIAAPFATTDCASEQDLRSLSNDGSLTRDGAKQEPDNTSLLFADKEEAVSQNPHQPSVPDAVSESESSSDGDSVGVAAAPLKPPTVPIVQDAPDTEKAVDESESSDDESVGVAAASNLPPADDSPVAQPAPPPPPPSPAPAPAVIESPITPGRIRKSTLAFEPMSPESPSQTPADFRDLRDVFRQASNDEGIVTMDQLRERLRSTKYTEEEVNSWFSGNHFDDSRNLNYKAILSEAIRSRRKIERLRVEEAFQKIDKGHQGFVTVGNLRAVLGSDNSEYIEKMLTEADTKRDGRITYEKFKEVLQRWNRTEI